MKCKPIKVLVVEDEILLLKNIKKKITAACSDFLVAGDAFNGKEALALIKDIRPDVIFTDIRMPVMDGLELSKIISENYPDIYTVIVSGYDDFEYARTALRYRVYNYLLKPLKMDALEAMLVSLKADICKKREQRLSSILDSKLSGGYPSAADTLYITELEQSGFSCFLVCFGNLHTHCQTYIMNHSLPEQFDESPWGPLFEAAPFDALNYWIFPQQFDNIKLLLIEGLNASPQDAGTFILNFLMEFYPQINVTLACSQNQVSFSELHSQRITLRKLLFSSLKIGHPCMIATSEAAALLPPAVLPPASINYFCALIQSNNTAGFSKAVRSLFLEWEENRYPQQWIEKMLMQFFTVLQQCLYFSDQDYEKMQTAVFLNLELESTLSGAVEKIIEEFLYWISLNKSVPTEIEAVIEEMDSYIRRHYKESVNISELAQKYHFNHSYLSRVFKKEKGQSPLKLINELRILDAKKLLSESVLSIKEISEVLGFTDQHYFSRIFKDFTGQTPKEYRFRQCND